MTDTPDPQAQRAGVDVEAIRRRAEHPVGLTLSEDVLALCDEVERTRTALVELRTWLDCIGGLTDERLSSIAWQVTHGGTSVYHQELFREVVAKGKALRDALAGERGGGGS